MPEAEKDSHVTLQVCYKLKNKFMRHNKNQFRLHKTFKFSLLLCWKQSSKKKKKKQEQQELSGKSCDAVDWQIEQWKQFLLPSAIA